MSSASMLAGHVILVNNDLTPNVQAAIVRQLQITSVISGAEYQARLAAVPIYYPTIIRQTNSRLLVVESYFGLTSFYGFDLGIFVKAGMATVEFVDGYGHCDGYGWRCGCWGFCNQICPSLTLPVDRMYWQELRHGTIPRRELCCPNPNVQNNILYPLTCHPCKPSPFPFGERCPGPIQPVCNPFGFHNIFCKCEE